MRRLCFLLFLLVSTVGLAQEKKSEKPTVVFTVRQVPTYTDEFIYLYKKNHQNKTEDFTEAKIDEYLDLFINFKLKVTEAKAMGLDTTAKFVKELNTYREDLKKPYRAEPDLLDKLTKETYERLTQEVRASHILISVTPESAPADTTNAYKKISDIKKRIEAGEDFEKLARELSEDPSAKYNGGDLGYFTAMQMVYPFELAAYNTKIGNLSPIVRTRFGYHLLKVIDKKPARGEVEVSHILLRATNPDDTKVKNTAFEIFDQLKAGRSWDDLCKEFSDDGNTKNNGGRLRPFGVGALASVPEFENTAFAMQNPGALSDPFKSAIGWHIIRLEKKIPLPGYAELESSLKRKVARDERLQVSQKNMASKRRKDFNWIENVETKKLVVAAADSSLTKGKWTKKWNDDSNKKTLFTIGTKKYLVSDFVGYIAKNQSATDISPSIYMDQLYLNFVDEKVNEVEEEKLIREKPEFKNLLNEYHEGILFFEIMEKEIWNKASADSTGQRNFYQSHQEKYKAGDRIEARIFMATDKSIIDGFKKKVEAGDSIKNEDIKKFKSVQPFRNYEKGESKVIDKITWAAGLHEVELDKNYYLVEAVRLVAPGIKTFEEARASIITDYQAELEKRWLESLRKKYPVAIDKKGKKAVLSALVKK
ncbi:MAG: peptidylprolyl isomerase [Bacteroidetes bacterium]|nr:peptidylprolyl isomerase [Bacteroidota bacterium]